MNRTEEDLASTGNQKTTKTKQREDIEENLTVLAVAAVVTKAVVRYNTDGRSLVNARTNRSVTWSRSMTVRFISTSLRSILASDSIESLGESADIPSQKEAILTR